MSPVTSWFSVRFDDRCIALRVSPPHGEVREESVAWERIVRVCWKAGDRSVPSAIYICTDEWPEGHVVPAAADGAEALWTELLVRNLFDARMAREAAAATNELFCSPLRRPAREADAFPLYSPRQLPDLQGDGLILRWDQRGAESIIRRGESEVWREKTGWEVYDRFEDITTILKYKYGSRLIDLVPTESSLYALYGDSTAAAFRVAHAREALKHDLPGRTFHWLQLERAVREGEAATVKQYLASGGDPNLRSVVRGSGATLLHIAARHRRPEMARMLIASGANVNVMDGMGKPPLVDALDTFFMPRVHDPFPPGAFSRTVGPEVLRPERTTELVRMLVLAGANLHGLFDPGGTFHGMQCDLYRPPVMLAAQYGYTEALRGLLDQGARVDAEDYSGNTSLFQALIYGQVVAMQILIAAGANVNRAYRDAHRSGQTPLLMLIKSPHFDQEHKVDLMRRLIAAGADVNKPDILGDSPVLTAVRYGTDRRYAIIGLADQAGKVEERIMSWPVQEKLSPAHIVALLEVLREAGADLDAPDRQGKTARDLAREAGLADVVARL